MKKNNDEIITEIINILKDKGYKIKSYRIARINQPFVISNIINDLVDNKLLEIKADNTEKVKKVIKNSDYEGSHITFEKAYDFSTLPAGYHLINDTLMYNLSILKDTNDIQFKSLVELDNELNESLIILEKWVRELPQI